MLVATPYGRAYGARHADVTKIFVNYRRVDEPAAAGRLFDQLERSYGPDGLFMDVANIRGGQDFATLLEDAVDQCDVFLAVIGPSWSDVKAENGVRRIDQPGDYVRLEIEAALKRDKWIIPVLVNNAQMPAADKLPPSIQTLLRRQAVVLENDRFGADVRRLIDDIASAFPQTPATSVERPSLPAPARGSGGTATSILVTAVLGGGFAVLASTIDLLATIRRIFEETPGLAVFAATIVALYSFISCIYRPLVSWAYDTFFAHGPDGGVDIVVARIQWMSRLRVSYRHLVSSTLARLTEFIGDEPERAWSARLFDRMMLFAFVYPFVSAFVGWIFLNDAGAAGAKLELHPASTSARALMFGLYLLVPLSIWRARTRTDDIRTIVRVGIVSSAGALAVFWALVGLDGPFTFALAAASVFGLVLIGRLAGGRSFSGIGAIAGAIGIALGEGLLDAIIFWVRGAKTQSAAEDPVAFSVVLVAVGIGTLAAALGFVYAFAQLRASIGNRTGLYTCIWGTLLVILIVGAAHVKISPGWYVYLGILPLLNGLFDFLSVGLTRKLLTLSETTYTKTWQRIALSLADGIGAALLMVGFVFCLAFVLEAVNLTSMLGPSKRPLLPLAPLYDRLQQGDLASAWFYFTILSTFIPTMIHAAVAFTALFLAVPQWVGTSNLQSPSLSELEKQWLANKMIFTAGAGAVIGAAIFAVPVLLVVSVLYFGDLIEVSRSGQRTAELCWGPIVDWWMRSSTRGSSL